MAAGNAKELWQCTAWVVIETKSCKFQSKALDCINNSVTSRI